MKNLQKIILCLLVLSALFLFGCDHGSNNFPSERQIKVIYDENIMTVYEQGSTDSPIVPSGGTVSSWSNPMVVIKLGFLILFLSHEIRYQRLLSKIS